MRAEREPAPGEPNLVSWVGSGWSQQRPFARTQDILGQDGHLPWKQYSSRGR